MNNFFSIIMPAYNADRYIKKAIESVINQIYKNWELIIIDDGSTDNTVNIIKNYVSSDNRIKLFRNPKKGAGAARNYGISKSKGKYLAFIDSDDSYSSNFISSANELIEKGSDCVIFDYITVKDGKNSNVRHTGITPYDSFTACWNKVYLKALWNGLRFDEDNRIEDLQIIPIVVYKAKNVKHVSGKAYYYYLYNNNSVTKSETIQESKRIIEAINKLIDNMKLYDMPFNLAAADFINQLIIPHLLRGIENSNSRKENRTLFIQITEYLKEINSKYFNLKTDFFCKNKFKRIRTKTVMFLFKIRLYKFGIKFLELSWSIGGMLNK